MLETDQLPDNIHFTRDRKEEKTKSRGKLTPDVQCQVLPPSSKALMPWKFHQRLHSLLILEEAGEGEGEIPRLLNKYNHHLNGCI